MQFQLIFRNAYRDRFELREGGEDQPSVDGQLITDGKIVAIYGRLWRATRLESHGITGFVVIPADTASEFPVARTGNAWPRAEPGDDVRRLAAAHRLAFTTGWERSRSSS